MSSPYVGRSGHEWPALSEPARTTYLIYVDDSGDENHDILCAICVPVDRWGEHLLKWKKYRKWFERTFEIPPAVELKCERLLTRGTAVFADQHTNTDYKIAEAVTRRNGRLQSRAEAFDKAMATLGACQGLRVLTCHKHTANGTGSIYTDVLLPWLEQWLRWDESMGVVWYDGVGDGLLEHHRAAHRSLPFERRVLEDVVHVQSHHSHLLQMADFCAHAAYKSIRADEGAESRSLVSQGYLRIRSALVPGGVDDEDFPDHLDERGIHGYAPEK